MVASAPGSRALQRTCPPSRKRCPHQKNSTPDAELSAIRSGPETMLRVCTSWYRYAVMAIIHTACRQTRCQGPEGRPQIRS